MVGNAVGPSPRGIKYIRIEGELVLQASRVRFRFDREALEVVVGEEADKSENAFVGGENRWKYSAFTNWEVRPSLCFTKGSTCGSLQA